MIQIDVHHTEKQMELQYEWSSMQPLSRLQALKELIQIVSVDNGPIDDLLLRHMNRIEQQYQFYITEEGRSRPDLQIEPGVHFAMPAPKPKILLQQISNADKEWTGILFSHDNKRPRFQTYYRCECGNSETIYVYERTKSLLCKRCQKRIEIGPATKKGLPKRGEDAQPYRDTFGNYYIGGLHLENSF